MKVIKKLLIGLIIMAAFQSLSVATDIDGLKIPDFAVVDGKNLVLNGTGFRKKFFVKVYLGALYLEKKSSSTEEILSMNTKSIKMHFIYKKVEKEKLKEAFGEGFEKNGADMKSDDVNAFLTALNFDVVSGEELDIHLYGENVQLLYKTNEVFKTSSKKLSDALIKIFIGDKPADSGLKNGMLGN